MNTFSFEIYGVLIHVIIRNNIEACERAYQKMMPEDDRKIRKGTLGVVKPFGRNAKDNPEVFVLLNKPRSNARFSALVNHESLHVAQYIYEPILKQKWQKMNKVNGFEESMAYMTQLVSLLILSIHETGKPDLWFFKQAENIQFKML